MYTCLVYTVQKLLRYFTDYCSCGKSPGTLETLQCPHTSDVLRLGCTRVYGILYFVTVIVTPVSEEPHRPTPGVVGGHLVILRTTVRPQVYTTNQIEMSFYFVTVSPRRYKFINILSFLLVLSQ